MSAAPLAAQVCYPGGYDKPMVLTRIDGARVVCRAAEATLACGNDVLRAAVDILAGDPLALLCADAACSVCVAKHARVADA